MNKEEILCNKLSIKIYTKEKEYTRSIELFKEIYATQGLMFALYFLADCEYNNEDLYNMAKLLNKKHND